MRNLPLSKVYRLFEPGPVVLLTTAHKGRANIMTMSWHIVVEFQPPLVACVVSNANHSFTALRRRRRVSLRSRRWGWRTRWWGSGTAPVKPWTSSKSLV